MRQLLIIFACTVLALPMAASAATGNDLVKWMPGYESRASDWNGGMLLGYVSGVAELAQGILYCAPDGVTLGQNTAIVIKYLKANPEQWNDQAPALIVRALQKVYPPCPKT